MDAESGNVSVVLCTYNGEKYLKDQLDSVINQTYPQLEIIIVDDRSTDGTKDILESYARHHKNIRLHFNEHNLGYNKNFEKAILLTGGEYISICDQDDIWFPQKIENLTNVIGDNWAVFSNSEYINSEQVVLNARLLKNTIPLDSYKNILIENFFTGHTSLLRRESLKYILPIPEKGFYDWWIGFVCLYHNKLIFHNEVLTQYRIHQNSVIQKINQEKKSILTDVDIQLENFLNYKNLGSDDKQFIKEIKANLKAPGIFKPLFFQLLKDYSQFFPKRNHRNLLSKLNFLRKFLSR